MNGVLSTAERIGASTTGEFDEGPWGNWPAHPRRSDDKPNLDAPFLERARKARSQLNGMTAQRTALLGLLLAALEDVPFADVARLAGVKEGPLENMMHGDAQVPNLYVRRWESLVQIFANLRCVLRPSATHRWLETPIPDLSGSTPLQAILRGKIPEVLAVTESYLDPSFA